MFKWVLQTFPNWWFFFPPGTHLATGWASLLVLVKLFHLSGTAWEKGFICQPHFFSNFPLCHAKLSGGSHSEYIRMSSIIMEGTIIRLTRDQSAEMFSCGGLASHLEGTKRTQWVRASKQVSTQVTSHVHQLQPFTNFPPKRWLGHKPASHRSHVPFQTIAT